MTLRLRVGRLLALLLIVIAQLGATPILASTTPAPTGTATASGTPAPSPSVSATATSIITPTATVSGAVTTSTPLTATSSPVATTAAATTTAVTETAPITVAVPLSMTTTVTPSTDILGDPAHAAHLKQQHPLHAALMTQSSKDPPPVSIVDPFNARLAVQVGANGRFNIGAFPDPATGGATATSWNLMYAWPGSPGTSFSTLRVDGADSIFGQDGTQVEAPTDIDARTNESAWRVGDILVTQTLQLVFNAQTGQDDVARIAYTATNTGLVAHDAGFRTMIDTMINNNDGAPFRVPGVGIVTHETDFTGDAVPDTFQAFFDLTDSTHVTASTLKSGGATVPDRLVLAAWPRIDGTAYDFTPDPSVDFSPSGYHDSAYAVYWNPAALAPGASRTFATLYGLAQENVDLQPPLALGVSGPAALSTANGQYSPNPFNVVATIYDNGTAPATGVQLTLNLPTGLSLAGDAATQTVGDLAVGQERQVSWSVQAAPARSPTTLTYGVTASATNTSSKTVQRQISVPAGGEPASGTIPWHPHQSVRFAAGLGASVDLADGHVDVGAADMSIPGRGPQLALNRTWDSLLAQRGVTTTAGEDWQSSLTPSMGGVLTGTVVFTDATGAVWPFVYADPNPTPAPLPTSTPSPASTPPTLPTSGPCNSPICCDPSTCPPTYYNTAARARAAPLDATAPYTTYTSPPGLPWQLTTSSVGYTLTNILTGAALTFDPQGRLLSDSDAYGNLNTVGYDQSTGAPTSEVNGSGRTLSFTATNSGLLSEAASPLWQASGGARGQHVTDAYSGTLLTAQTLGAGTADAVTTTFGYSGTQLVTVTTGMGHQWLLGYDDRGRVSAITTTDTTPANVTQFSYNPGQTVVIEGFGQPHQRATIYALDGQGQATSIEDAVGDTTAYTYDQQHDVTSRADANNASGHDTTTHYAYTYASPDGSLGPDGTVGLLTQETSPPVGTYNPQSALAAQTTTYQYDPHTFDLVEVDKPGGGKTRYSYDGRHGRVATIELINMTSSGCGGPQAQIQARPSTAQPQRAAILVARPMTAPAACGTSQHTFSQWRGQLTGIDASGEITGTTDARGVTVASTEDTATPVAMPNAVVAAYTQQDGYTDTTGNDFGDLTRASSAPITTTRGANTPVTTGYAYDGDGNPITTTTPNGAVVVVAYDYLGRPTRTTRPGVALSVLGPTVTITTRTGYDGDGNVITATDGAGDVTRAVYDALGRTIQTINPVGATTVYTYSGAVLTDVQNTMGQTTHYDYDGADRPIGVTDPLGVHTQYSPDAVGNTTAITTPLDDNNSQANSVETRGYDALNRANSDTVGGVGETSPSAAQTTTTSYDADGNVAQVQAPNGDVTYHTYDILDRPQWNEVDPGLLTVPPTSAVAPPASEAYGFDAADNLTFQSDFTTRAHQMGFDAANRLSVQTDQSSCGDCAIAAITTTLGADADGNVTQATRQEGAQAPATTSTQYNAADWTLSQDDGPGATYALYDTAGRLVGQSLSVGASGLTPLGLTAGQVNRYDKEGRVTQTWDGAQGASPLTTLSTFAYNAADLPVTTTLHAGTANQTQEQRSYDADNRLICVSAAGPLSAQVPLVESVGYAHSPLGVTTAISSYVANSCQLAAPALVQALGYDAQGRLTATGGSQWSYDGNGNLTSVAVSHTAALSYTYANADGSEPGGWLPNELVSTHYYNSTGPLASSYGYDGSGATTAIVITPTGSLPTVRENLGYNAQGLLAGVSTSDGLSVTLGYNARGLRARIAVTDTALQEWTPLGPLGKAATRFTETVQYRGDRVGQVTVADAADPFDETFLYRPDGAPLELLYQRAGHPLARYWYVLDGQGSVVALVDATGSVVDRYRYDLWGQPVVYQGGAAVTSEGVPQPLRYRGYWYDGWYDGAGLWTAGHGAYATPYNRPLPWYWLTTRPYDPALERFLQPDPSSRDGVRSYTYAHDDPVDLADPSGLAGEPLPGGDTGAEGVPAASAGSAGGVGGVAAVEPATGAQLPGVLGAAGAGLDLAYDPSALLPAPDAPAGLLESGLIDDPSRLLAPVASADPQAALRQLVEVEPPRNYDLAGQTYSFEDPVLQDKYPEGVPFTELGFPDFSRYAHVEVQIKMQGNWDYDREGDFASANEAAGFRRSRSGVPRGYTWHHVEDRTTMQLVPRDLHEAIRHSGGVWVIRRLGPLP